MKITVNLHPKWAQNLCSDPRRIESNVGGFISWGRLVEALRQTGEFRNSEEVEAFVLTDDGIQYFVRRR